MSLSTLLSKLQPELEKHVTLLPAPWPGCQLFLSVSNGKERATVINVTGDNFHHAWEKGTRELQRVVKRHKLKVKWLKADWTRDVTEFDWKTFKQQELLQTKRNYYRYGIALDPELKYSFLEQELNGNATLYMGGKQAMAELNEKNFTRYAHLRFHKKIPLDFSDQSLVYRLDNQGIFCSTEEEPQLLYGVSREAGRRIVDDLDEHTARRLITTSSDYLASQVLKSGRFNYGWHPCFDRAINTYNTLRHASSTYAMLEGWEVTQCDTLLESIKRSLSYLSQELIQIYTLEDGSQAAFLTDLEDEIKLGGNAVCLLAFTKYTELLDDQQYLPLLEQLALGIRHMQNPDNGSFVHVLNSNDLSVKDAFRTIYYEGEAAFGLMRLYGLTRDERWLKVVTDAFEYFIEKDHWKTHDHWLSYCVNELTLYRPEARYYEFGIKNFSGHLDFVLERITTFPTLLELMMAAHKMICRLQQQPEFSYLLEQIDLEKFHQALKHRAHYLMNGYFWPEYAMYFQNPAKIVGSCYIRHHAFRVRIDDVEHYLSGYVAYLHYYLGVDTPAHGSPEPALEAESAQDSSTVPVRAQSESTSVPARIEIAEDQFMPTLNELRRFDPRQLWRFFVDGRFHKKYNGWTGYEAGERGSIPALLNAFRFMLENFDISEGLKATYLRELHKACMMGVETANKKSSPGDIRYLNSGMPFFAKSTTYEHLKEVFELRRGDGTVMFNTAKYAYTADELNVDEIYQALLKDKRINYRNWYPNLNQEEEQALQGQSTLKRFYEVKHKVQMLMVEKTQEIVDRYNSNIAKARTADEKLRVITLVSREMELLHPFPDGNCRTFSCILQTQLLMFNGFLPAILENPNLDNEVSHDQWIEEVRKGIKRTEQLLEDPEIALFNYSINDMPEKDQKAFLDMADPVIKWLSSHEESWLTPERLEKLSGGSWFNINRNLRFTGVGDYNTYRSGQIYFMLSLEEWKEEGKDPFTQIKNLKSKGIRALVSDDPAITEQDDLPVLLVSHIRDCYNHIATETRQGVNPTTILVTGTEGKTGFKTQLHHILQPQIQSHANINSANTEIPVLRSLINLRKDDKVEINEVSVGGNEALRLERSHWVNPDICVFTNISPNHMDMHKTIDNIIHAKSSVVAGLRDNGLCIINRDMPYFEPLKQAILERNTRLQILTFGSSADDDAQLISQTFNQDKFGWDISARIEDEKLNYFIPMLQEHAGLASLPTLLCVKKLGLNVSAAAQAYASLKPYETMGRMVRLKKPQGDILFYDQSRRGAIGGMQSAFNDLSRLKVKGKVVALVGGISIKKDSDWTRDSHTTLAEMINRSPVDKLYTTGNFMHYVHDNLDNKAIYQQHSDDLDFLAKELLDQLEPDDLLFIIGSAYLYLGRVTDRILKQVPYEIFNYKKPLLNKPALLLNFFQQTGHCIEQEHGLTDVSDQLSRGYTPEKCKAWFYNNTSDSKEKGRQVFGSYFDFGSDKYLLHIDCATMNIHLGLVRYQRTENGGYKQSRMTEEEFSSINKTMNSHLNSKYPIHFRGWGGSWCSIDFGKMIDPENNQKHKILSDFKETVFYSDCLKPLLAAVKALQS